MGREARDYIRVRGVRNPDLIVIAAEGACTEKQYFEGLRDELGLSNLQLKVIERNDPTQSSPRKVFEELKQYKKANGIGSNDELCIVIDRDRWGDQQLSEIAQNCD